MGLPRRLAPASGTGRPDARRRRAERLEAEALFSSPAGVKFHREFTGTETSPEVVFNRVERGQIDDAVVLSLLARARAEGCDAYVVPQRDDLPMANRREDILVRKP